MSLIATSACATAAGTIIVPHLVMSAMPAGEIGGGEGEVSRDARTRLEREDRTAQLAIARGAIASATAYPRELRLQRRAAALVRTLDDKARRALGHDAIEPVLARLATTPCPGLADIAATRLAYGDDAHAGSAYVAAAHACSDVDAAIAAVGPLRAVHRCDEAIDTLRAMWPRVDRMERGATVRVLDAVRACSDDLNLRENLAFVPDDVVADYFAVLDARAREALAAEQRAALEAARERDEQRARDASWHCESECSSAESSCTSSCRGDAQCMQRCESVLHVCRSGCGAP